MREGAGLLFTFFDRAGQMRTVDRLRDVESEARRAVMVTDPHRTLGGDRVYVADLTVQDTPEGTFPSWIEEKGTWLDRVMPRVSVATLERPGAGTKDGPSAGGSAAARPARRRGASRRGLRRTTAVAEDGSQRAVASGTADAASQGAAAPAAAMPKVIVFGTTWCPSCRLARDYLRQRGVRFLDVDVEQQPEAGKKMVEIQQANGMRPGAVPLIIVNGRVFQGFSRFQLEVAINNLQQAKAS
ncbi:MAG: hypothetical protein IPL40_06295 [Proteobacteria bacterium]|nr:hypothetical protein [Pseudomonadota bacterium]